MKFSNIEAFITIVETGSLSKASKLLFISQPTISRRLQSLEEELEVTLINRLQGKRNITLTEEGLAFVPIARQWLALLKDSQNIKNKQLTRTINIGMTDSLCNTVFSPIIKDFAQQYSSIPIHVGTHHSEELYVELSNHRLDIAYVRRSYEYQDILVEALFEEPMKLIRRKRGELNANPVHPKDLDPSSFICIPWNTSFSLWLNYWFADRKPYITVDSINNLINFLDIPNSWSIIPCSNHSIWKDMEICDIINGPESQTCYQLTHRYPRKGIQPSLDLFSSFAQEYLK